MHEVSPGSFVCVARAQQASAEGMVFMSRRVHSRTLRTFCQLQVLQQRKSMFPCVKINMFFLAKIHMTIYIHIALLTFPETQAHSSKTAHWQMLFYHHRGVVIYWSNKNTGTIEKGGWRNMVDGKGKPKAFFFFRKDGFLWKNMLPSGDIEKLPCIGFIFPKIICNECTQILPFPS